MTIDAALVQDIHARLQLLSCGQLLTFSGWSALASDIDLPRKGRVVKEAVYWLEKSSTAQVEHTSPTRRQDDGGHMRQTKHSIRVGLSADQQKVLDRFIASDDRRLVVIINGPYHKVLADFFDVADAGTIIEAFVTRKRLSKDVAESKTRRATYTLVG